MRSRTVLVRGPSMLPTLRDGDCLLVSHRARIRPGDLVLARFHALPEVLVVKRAVEQVEDGWLLASDNPAVEGYGVTRGPGAVEARVLLRYWPLPVSRLRRA